MAETPQNRGKKLIKNIGIYALGNISSKLIMFMLLPIYSFYIIPEEMGKYDIMFMVVTALMPIVSMQLRDGTFRFMVDTTEEERHQHVVTYAIKNLARNSIVCACIGVFLYLAFPSKYIWYVMIFTSTMSMHYIILQAVRGLGFSTIFAQAGVITSLLIFATTLPLVITTDLGIDSIFIGNIVARLIVLLWLEHKVKVFSRYFIPRLHDKELAREIRKFCLPLVVVTLLTWGLTSLNRFFIQHYLGYHENGLYAVVQKIASILDTMASIFYQAWQESAIKQYNDKDRNKFYSTVFNTYIWVLVLLVIGIGFGAYLLYPYIANSNYQDSKSYLYPLLTTSMLISICYFYEIGYQCVKETIKQLPGLLIALGISLVGNFVLVQLWGMYGILATLNITYIVLIAIRVRDTKKYLKIGIEWRSYAALGILIAGGVLFYLLPSTLGNISAGIVLAALLLACMPPDLQAAIKSKLNRNK